MPPSPDQTEHSASLTRGVGRWGILALTINCVVGAGILGLPGKVYALSGAWTGLVVAGAALLATGAALCLAELGSRFDGTGGPVEYCRAAFGRPFGFAAGWLLWTATVLGSASLLNLLAGLIAPQNRLLVVIGVGLAMTGLAMAGIARSAAASTMLTVLKLALLAGFVVAGLSAPTLPAAPLTTPPHLANALILLFFAFIGFERPTAVAGEVIDARRAVPFALVAGLAVVAVLYAGVFAACLRGVPDLASSDQPVRELAERVLGTAGAQGLSWAAALIILGTLATQWITAPRLILALAREGQLPSPFALLSSRRTPDLAILLTGAAAILLALTGDFVATIAASSASRLIIFAGCAAALLRLRRQPDAPPARFRLPAATAFGIGVILTCALLLASATAELVRVTVILLVGASLWFITTRLKRA